MYDDAFIGQVICIQIGSPYMLDRTLWATVLSLSFIISDGSTGGDVCLGRISWWFTPSESYATSW